MQRGKKKKKNKEKNCSKSLWGSPFFPFYLVAVLKFKTIHSSLSTQLIRGGRHLHAGAGWGEEACDPEMANQSIPALATVIGSWKGA